MGSIANVDYSALDLSSGGGVSGSVDPSSIVGSTDLATGVGGDSSFTSLGGLFSSLGTTIAQDYRAISGPTSVRPGTVIIGPNGQPVTAGISNLSSGNGLILLLGFGLLLVLLLRR